MAVCCIPVNILENPELVEERILCRGRRIEVVQRVYRWGGAEFVRDVVRFGQSVAIVPLKSDKKVILIKQFRAPLNDWILEIPAGRVEQGESLEETARRELEEEIGYIPRRLIKVASIYMTPGYSDEVLHIFIALDLEKTEMRPEVGELIEVIEMDLGEALKTLLSKGIADSKTLLGLLLTCHYLKIECPIPYSSTM